MIDIETAPNLGYFWRIFKENIGIDQIMDSGYVLSWSACWYDSKHKIIFDAIWKSGEKKMLQHIHRLLNEADVVVHFNGTSFDIPTLNKEFIKYKMLPPAPYKQVDLCKLVQREFRFTSSKLDFVLKELGLGRKVRHPGFTLWVNTMNGNRAAQNHMERYNKGDVRGLVRLYERMIPWIRNHPNHGSYDDSGGCPRCGSNKFQRRGSYVNRVYRYARLQCNKCGGWFRGNKTVTHRGAERFHGL